MRNRYYQGPLTDHFDGLRFFHPGLPSADKTLLDILKWKLQAQRTPWPKSVPARTGVRPADQVEGLQITHIGHSSYLLQTGNQNILVDPVWSDRASPFTWAGPRRYNPPAIAFKDLPHIDAVLVTHNHYDHLDTEVLGRLWHVHRPRILTPLGNDTIIRASTPAIEVETGDWWSTFFLTKKLKITVVPSYHWSSRRLGDYRMALWGGFVLEAPAGVVYCAGDTGYRDGAIFREIAQRFPSPVASIVPIGAYAPRWFMQTQHTDPQEALQIAETLGTKHVLGVHWGTFSLTDEPFDEPAHHFDQATQTRHPGHVHYQALKPGDTFTAIR